MCGIINPKGKFVREGERIRHDKYGMGSYVIAFEKEIPGSVKDVEITRSHDCSHHSSLFFRCGSRNHHVEFRCDHVSALPLK